ncbi:TPA: hypothetical protein RQK93_004480 [Vibrio vulnificus]|nr:hypothetical protein [Vibrio vulnificus]
MFDKLYEIVERPVFVFVIFLVTSLSCLSFGWLMGVQANSSVFIKHLWRGIVELSTIGAGGGTMVAAWVATRAFSTWREQFKYEKTYQAIIDLERAYIDYVKCFLVYKDNYLWSLRVLKGAVVSPHISKKIEHLPIYEEELAKSYESLKSAFDWADSIQVGKLEDLDMIVETTNMLADSILNTLTQDSLDNNNDVLSYRTAQIQKFNTFVRNVRKRLREVRNT